MSDAITLPEHMDRVLAWARGIPGVETVQPFGAVMDDCQGTTVVVEILEADGLPDLGLGRAIWEGLLTIELSVLVPRDTDSALSAFALALELGLQARWQHWEAGPVTLARVDREMPPELVGQWDGARVVLEQVARFRPYDYVPPIAESVNTVLASQPPDVGPEHIDEYEVVSGG